MTTNIDIIIPSYHSKELTTLAINSLEKNKSIFNFRYIVVENASDESYKEDIISLNENVVWYTNSCEYSYLSSETNAEAIQKGIDLVDSELVFICHNDVLACHPYWMDFLHSKIQEGCSLVGTVLDNTRIGAVHISGLLVKTEIAKEVSCFPERNSSSEVILDVGDSYTRYCREKNLKYYCCRNTHNNNINEEELQEPFNNFSVDRAVDDAGNVIFAHLGRGTLKQFNQYSKPNKIYFEDWLNFFENYIE